MARARLVRLWFICAFVPPMPRSYTLIGIAVATAADVALDTRGGGGCGQVFRWVLSLPLWWPLAALAYCAFLTQMAVDVVVYAAWLSPFRNGVWYTQRLYLAALAMNLAIALGLALVVERPCLKIRSMIGPQLAAS